MILRSFLVFSLLFVSTCYSHSNFSIQSLLLNDTQPTPALLELLELLGVQHDGSLSTIVTETQKAWLRKPGTERWHIQELITQHQEKIFSLLEQLGCIQEVKPSKANYTYGIVLGATVTRVRLRLSYLIGLWNSGIRFESLVLLGGQRPLDPTVEAAEILLLNTITSLPNNPSWMFNGNMPKTEYDMMCMVVAQTDFPPDMAKIPIQIVDTPMLKKPDGTLQRPGTTDIVASWLTQGPKPGSCLCVSNQPYIGHQDSSLKTILPSTFSVETVGEGARSQEKIAVILDSIARWLYQEKQRRQIGHQ